MFDLRCKLKKGYETPIVSIFSSKDASADFVGVNVEGAMEEAVKVLADYGHEHIVFIGEPLTKRKADRYQSVMKSCGKGPGYVVESPYRFEKAGEDCVKQLLGFPPAPIFMLLADCEDVCTVPENDSLGSGTQLMVKHLTGQCAFYLEFCEFMEDRVLTGVPDYIPAAAADGEVQVMPAAFGELSEGILNVSKVKPGKLTMCRLTSCGDKYYMHIVTGEGVAPRKWEEAGWTQPAPQLPGLEIMLEDVEAFAQKVMCQHYIIAMGDQTRKIKNLCDIMGIEVI